jgi:pilus assembly protein Flp/PilA
MLEQLKKLLKDEEAPTAVEYGLMLAAIAVVVMGVAFQLGGTVTGKFEDVDGQMGGGTSSGSGS